MCLYFFTLLRLRGIFEEIAKRVFKSKKSDKQYANADTLESYIEEMINKQIMRVESDDLEELMTLTKADLI